MLKTVFVVNYPVFFLLFCGSLGKKWTEDDEKRRIAQIKAEERQQFRMEMGGQVSGFGGDDLYDDFGSKKRGSDYSSEQIPNYRSQKSFYPSRFTESPQIPPTPPPTAVSPLPVSVNGSQPVNWCFQCSSPMKILSEPMRQAIQNLLDVRRSQMPKHSIVYDCHQPANIKTLPKVQCLHSYCQTLVLTEHERGVSFAMRGCAEHFAAIDEAVLEARGDNECVKLHQKIDLRECVCKSRKYCYKGSEDPRIEAAANQNVHFFAKLNSAPNSRQVFNLICAILLFQTL